MLEMIWRNGRRQIRVDGKTANELDVVVDWVFWVSSDDDDMAEDKVSFI